MHTFCDFTSRSKWGLTPVDLGRGLFDTRRPRNRDAALPPTDGRRPLRRPYGCAGEAPGAGLFSLAYPPPGRVRSQRARSPETRRERVRRIGGFQRFQAVAILRALAREKNQED